MKPSFHTITINTRCIILNCSGIITDGGRSRGKSCDDGDNLVVQRRDQSNGGSLSSRILPMMSSPLLLLERPSIIIRHRSNNASSVNCEMMQTAFLNPLCHHLRGSNRGISTNITDSTNTDTMTPEKQDIVTIARTTKYSSKCAQQRLNDDENKDVKNHVSDDTQSTTKTHNDEHDDDDEWKVNQRTWRQKIRAALLVEPYADQVGSINLSKRTSYRSIAEWMIILQKSWSAYKETWEGFSDNITGSGAYDQNSYEEKEKDDNNEPVFDTDAMIKTTGDLSDNAERNVKALKEEGFRTVEVIKEATGVRNKRDFKAWAATQIKLTSVCVNEFMTGYRKGRDDEVDKMLNEYFKEIDEKVDDAGVVKGITKKDYKTAREVEGGDNVVKSKEDEEAEKEPRITGARRRRNRKQKKI